VNLPPSMRTRGPGPDELLTPEPGADPALVAYLRLARLKRLYRQGWLQRSVPAALCESVADHSLSVALLALLVAGPSGDGGAFGRIDPAHAALLALIHELGESYAGDITPRDGIPRDVKEARERAAILYALEGHPSRAWLLGLWEEYAAASTPEARFVKELDRLEMGLTAAAFVAEGHPGAAELLEAAREALTEPRLAEILAQAAREVPS